LSKDRLDPQRFVGLSLMHVFHNLPCELQKRLITNTTNTIILKTITTPFPNPYALLIYADFFSSATIIDSMLLGLV